MKGANLLVFIVLARILSISELGLYGYVVATTVLVTHALDFGTRHSITYHLGLTDSDEGAIISQATIWGIAFSVAGGLTFALMVRALEPSLDSPRLLIPAALIVPGLLLTRVQQGVMLGKGLIGAYNRAESIPRVVALCGTGLLWALDAITLESSLWVLAGGALASGFYLQFLTLRLGKFSSPTLEVTKKILARGAQFLPGAFLMISSKRIGYIILISMTSSDAAGAFFGTVRVSEILTEISLAIGVVVFSYNARSDSSASAIADAARVTRIMLASLFSLGVLLFAFADSLVPIMLGAQFSDQGHLFRIAVVAAWLGALWVILYPSLSALASPLISFWVFLPGVSLNILLTYLFVREWGALGAAYAMVISQAVISGSFLFVFWRMFKAHPTTFLLIKRKDVAEIKDGLMRRLKSTRR